MNTDVTEGNGERRAEREERKGPCATTTTKHTKYTKGILQEETERAETNNNRATQK